jgi:RNA polymerase sigma-70 factor (sigma-E family)
MTTGEPSGLPARQDKVTETLVAATPLGPVTAKPHLDALDPAAGGGLADCGTASGGFADEIAGGRTAKSGAAANGYRVSAVDAAITELYGAHYKSLVRLATLLVHDISTAEEVVQDSFVALHAGLHRLRDNEKALSYLRAAVVNRSRSVLRHRVVVDRNAPKAAPDMPSAEHGAMALIERSSVLAALRLLPERQREVVVLRFYGDLSEAQIAITMGITRGAVKSHTSRAMSALRSVLERDS